MTYVRTFKFIVGVLGGLLASLAMSQPTSPSVAQSKSKPPISAQNPTPVATVDFSGQIGDVLTQRATKVLSRYISQNDFYVTASVQSKDSAALDLPYLPAAQTADALLALSNNELNALIGSVNIDIWLNKKFDAETKSTLMKLVQSDLGIKSTDAVTVKDMQITVAAPVDAESQKMLEKAQNDLRQAMTELKALERERNDLKMANLLKENRNIQPPAVTDGKPKDAEKEAKTEIPEKKEETIVDRFLAASPAIAGLVLFVLALIFVGRAFSSSIRTVGSGMSSVAAALSSMGGNLGMRVEKEADEKTEETPKFSSQQNISPQQAGTGQNNSGNIHERILRLHDEIAASMGERTESIILQALTDMLQRPETVAKAVATLELLGKDKSNALFKRLGKHSRETILDFLENGDYGRSKTDLMLEAGEAIKTKLLAEGFGNLRGEMTIKMTEKMLMLAEADYYDIFMSLGDQYKPRLMFYLESEPLGRLLTLYGQKNPDKVETVMDLLAKIADVESSVEMDPIIAATIEAYLGGRKEDVQEKYVGYYQKILETMDGELAEKAVDKLSDKSHVLREQLKGFVITLNTLFKLPPDTRMNMLENLSNKELASLISGAPDDQAAVVWESVSRRRVDLIKDELELLKQMAPTAMKVVFNETKGLIIGKLKKMRDSGEISDLFESKSEPVADTPPRQIAPATSVDQTIDYTGETLPQAALDKLIALGFSKDDLQKVNDTVISEKISHTHALENLAKVESRALIDTLALALETPAVHLEDRDLQKAILDLLPADVAHSLRVIPIERSANNLIVATGRPLSQTMLKALHAKTNYVARAVLASEHRISEALQKYYSAKPEREKLKAAS